MCLFITQDNKRKRKQKIKSKKINENKNIEVQTYYNTLKSNYQDSTQTKGYINIFYTVISPIQLNISTLSDLYSLFVSFTSPLILGYDHQQNYI